MVPELLAGPLCLKCGKPLRKERRDDVYCPACAEREHTFDRVFSVFTYQSTAPSLYRFKYGNRPEYAEFYADCFVRRYGGLPRGIRVDALVPVPLHAAKLRKRGYNQAEVFARALSARLHTPVVTDLVARVKPTRPQKELDYYGRLNNLKKAFIIRKNDVKYNRIALVDDIFTTGSTADNIAALLKKQGVRNVYVFTPALVTDSYTERGM